MYTVNAGEAILIYLGTSISSNGEEVNVIIESDGIDFVNFDESKMELYTNEGVTTNEEQGIYTIKITLTEETNDLSETYTI